MILSPLSSWIPWRLKNHEQTTIQNTNQQTYAVFKRSILQIKTNPSYLENPVLFVQTMQKNSSTDSLVLSYFQRTVLGEKEAREDLHRFQSNSFFSFLCHCPYSFDDEHFSDEESDGLSSSSSSLFSPEESLFLGQVQQKIDRIKQLYPEEPILKDHLKNWDIEFHSRSQTKDALSEEELIEQEALHRLKKEYLPTIEEEDYEEVGDNDSFYLD